MTSTNDGKDVKSYQTSGQKGKSYYIELYKSLDARLSGECGLSERTQHLCEAWRRVHSLCLHSAPATHPHLLSWLQRHTARTILHTKWSKEQQDSLEEAIDVFIEETNSGRACKDGVSPPWETQLLLRGQWFRRELANPWGHPVLRLLLDPQGEPPADDEILEWLKEERGVMFVTRLRQLATSKCGDLAVLLVTAVMDRVRAATPLVPDSEQSDEPREKPKPAPEKPTFADILTASAGFTVEVWELLTDIEFVLLHKGDSRSKCIDLAKQTPLRNGYQLVERLQGRLETSPREKKLWKNAKDVATLIAQVVIARCMVVPVCNNVSRTALYCCTRSLVRLLPPEKLESAAAALAAPAATARHLHTLAAATLAQRGSELTPFVCELYVRAITAGMNELERLKLNKEKEAEARLQEQTLSTWFTQLGTLLSKSSRLRCECTLTAFSVHPSPAMYVCIQQAPPLPCLAVEQHVKAETTSEFGSWATDSRTQTNLVKTSETLNLKHTQHQANVLSTATLTEGEALGLSAELCQDLAVLLSGPRVKTLSWDMDREMLLENCRGYMERTHGGTRALTTELKYLNLDPRAYQHLPEEDDTAENDAFYGIEKGYEHLVELQEQEEIWQDAYSDPERTESVSSCNSDIPSPATVKKKKKKKAPILSSEEDSDPLSLVAEAKRTEKKKERPHSKERSKERKEKKKSKSKDGSEKKESSRERRKEGSDPKEKKEKKPRKKKIKEEIAVVEHKPGSLSSLIGLKVAKVKIPEGKYKRNTETSVSAPCITDSDYDSQGKSSLASLNSEGNDPDVLFDGLYNMEDYKSPEKGDPLADRSTFTSSELSVANGRVAINTTSLLRKDDKKYTLHTTQNKPQDLNTSKNAAIREVVKRSISKLIEFRRQKSLLEETQILKSAGLSPATSYSDKSVSPKSSPIVRPYSDNSASLIKSPSAIIRPEFPEPAVISPKAVEVPEIPKAYINKKQTESLKELKHGVDTLIQSKYSNNPVIQYANKQPAQPSCESSFQQYIQQRQQLITHYSNFGINQNKNSVSVIHKSLEDPEKEIQRSFQDFLRELQESINAGTGANNKANAPKNVPAKKDIKPISRVTPVIPNYPKTEPGTSYQCAKPTIQSTKKVDNQLNTFARLSYMHKNKQSDVKFNKQCAELSNQEKQQIMARSIDEHKSSKIKYLQNKGDISILRVGHNAHSLLRQDESQVVIRKMEKPSPAALDHPVLTNMLHGNNATGSKKTIRNETPLRSVPYQPEKPMAKATALSEQDQNDLLLLLRQQNKLNSPVPYLSPDLNKIVNSPQYSKDAGASHTIPLNCNQVTSATKSVTRHLPIENKSNKVQQFEGCRVRTVQCDSIPDTHAKSTTCKSGKVSKTTTSKKANVTLSKIQNVIPCDNREANVNLRQTYGSQDNVSQILDTNKPNVIKKVTKVGTIKKPNITLTKVPNAAFQTQQASSHLGATMNPRENILPSGGEPQDWESVMDALLSHKTPSLGPNALDVALKKDSFAKTALRNQRIVRKKEHQILDNIPHKQGHSTKHDIVTPTHTNVKPEQSVVTDLSMKKAIQNKDSETVRVDPPKQNIQKSHLCDAVKEKDPFISGIPNSDYDLLEELMDDELRKEIGELSSDEDTYRAPAVIAKFIKTAPSSKCTNVIKNLSNQVIQAVDSRRGPSSIVQNARESIIQTNKRTVKTYEAPKNVHTNKSLVQAINIANTKLHEADNRTKNLENVTRPCPKIQVPVANVHSNSQSSKIHTYNVNQNSNRCQANLVNMGNMLITTTPVKAQSTTVVQSEPATPKVVVIGSDVLFDPFSVAAVQTPMAGLCNVNQPQYIALNTTPNIAVYQTTQFAAPIVNPVIIGNAMTASTTERIQETTHMPSPAHSQNKSRDQIDLSKAPEISQDCAKVASLQNVTYIESKSKNIQDQSLQNDSNSEVDIKVNLDINFNKNAARKVLSEVQDKQAVNLPEKEDSKATRNQNLPIENDLKKEVLKDQEKPQIESEIQKQTNILDNISKQVNEEDAERIMTKRLAILDRTTLHKSNAPAIPLEYEPLITSKKTINNVAITDQDKKILPISSIQNCNDKNVTADNVLNNKAVFKQDNLSNEHCKENDSKTTQCRRILLRSSNDLKAMTVTSNLQDQRNPVGRKTKVRLKSETKNKDHDVNRKSATDDKKIQEKDDTDSPKRISKRILDRNRNSLKMVENEDDRSKQASNQNNKINVKEKVTEQVCDTADKIISDVVSEVVTNHQTVVLPTNITTEDPNPKEVVTSINIKSGNNDVPSAQNIEDFGLIDIEDALLGSKIPKIKTSEINADLSKKQTESSNESLPRSARKKRRPRKYSGEVNIDGSSDNENETNDKVQTDLGTPTNHNDSVLVSDKESTKTGVTISIIRSKKGSGKPKFGVKIIDAKMKPMLKTRQTRAKNINKKPVPVISGLKKSEEKVIETKKYSGVSEQEPLPEFAMTIMNLKTNPEITIRPTKAKKNRLNKNQVSVLSGPTKYVSELPETTNNNKGNLKKSIPVCNSTVNTVSTNKSKEHPRSNVKSVFMITDKGKNNNISQSGMQTRRSKSKENVNVDKIELGTESLNNVVKLTSEAACNTTGDGVPPNLNRRSKSKENVNVDKIELNPKTKSDLVSPHTDSRTESLNDVVKLTSEAACNTTGHGVPPNLNSKIKSVIANDVVPLKLTSQIPNATGYDVSPKLISEPKCDVKVSTESIATGGLVSSKIVTPVPKNILNKSTEKTSVVVESVTPVPKNILNKSTEKKSEIVDSVTQVPKNILNKSSEKTSEDIDSDTPVPENIHDISTEKTSEVVESVKETTTKDKDTVTVQDSFKDLKDKIIIEELPTPSNDSSKKCVRIKLPNGKTFKATVFGKMHVSFDSIFADPALKSALLSNLNDTKRYTVNIKQVSTAAKNDPQKIVDARIEEVNVQARDVKPIETVNLLSDDEEEADSIKNMQTGKIKFGDYRIIAINEKDFQNHQNKLQQKCFVKLMKMVHSDLRSSLVSPSKSGRLSCEADQKAELQGINVLNKIKKAMAAIEEEINSLEKLNDLSSVTLNNQIDKGASGPIKIDDDANNDNKTVKSVSSPIVIDDDNNDLRLALNNKTDKDSCPIKLDDEKNKNDLTTTLNHQRENEANCLLTSHLEKNKDNLTTSLIHLTDEDVSCSNLLGNVDGKDNLSTTLNNQTYKYASCPIVLDDENNKDNITTALSQSASNLLGNVDGKDDLLTTLNNQTYKNASCPIVLDDENNKDNITTALSQSCSNLLGNVDGKDYLSTTLNNQTDKNTSCPIVLDDENNRDNITTALSPSCSNLLENFDGKDDLSTPLNNQTDKNGSCPILLDDENNKDNITTTLSQSCSNLLGNVDGKDDLLTILNNQTDKNTSCPIVLDDENNKDTTALSHQTDKDERCPVALEGNDNKDNRMTSFSHQPDEDASSPLVLDDIENNDNLTNTLSNQTNQIVSSPAVLTIDEENCKENLKILNQDTDKDAICPLVLDEVDNKENLTKTLNNQSDINASCSVVIDDENNEHSVTTALNNQTDKNTSHSTVSDSENSNENLKTTLNNLIDEDVGFHSKYNITTPMINTIVKVIPDVIEIDDSSNDSLEILDSSIAVIEETLRKEIANVLRKPILLETPKEITKKPDQDIDELKKLLLKDLGVEVPNVENKQVIAEPINPIVVENDEEDALFVKTKECFVRLQNCDELAEEYEKKRIMKQRCIVDLVRCDDMIAALERDHSNVYSDENELLKNCSDDNMIDLDAVDIETSLNLESKRSRSGSFSLLDEFPVYFDDKLETSYDYGRSSPVMDVFDVIASLQRQSKANMKEDLTNQLYDTSSEIYELARSSPVMEIYETIASYRNFLKATQKKKTTEKKECCYWHDTKRDLHLANTANLTNAIHYAEIATEIKLNEENSLLCQPVCTTSTDQLSRFDIEDEVPSLKMLTVKLFQSDEILSRLRPYTLFMNKESAHSPSHKLKRKLRIDEEKGAASKVLKVVMKNTSINENIVISNKSTKTLPSKKRESIKEPEDVGCSDPIKLNPLDICLEDIKVTKQYSHVEDVTSDDKNIVLSENSGSKVKVVSNESKNYDENILTDKVVELRSNQLVDIATIANVASVTSNKHGCHDKETDQIKSSNDTTKTVSKILCDTNIDTEFSCKNYEDIEHAQIPEVFESVCNSMIDTETNQTQIYVKETSVVCTKVVHSTSEVLESVCEKIINAITDKGKQQSDSCESIQIRNVVENPLEIMEVEHEDIFNLKISNNFELRNIKLPNCSIQGTPTVCEERIDAEIDVDNQHVNYRETNLTPKHAEKAKQFVEDSSNDIVFVTNYLQTTPAVIEAVCKEKMNSESDAEDQLLDSKGLTPNHVEKKLEDLRTTDEEMDRSKTETQNHQIYANNIVQKQSYLRETPEVAEALCQEHNSEIKAIEHQPDHDKKVPEVIVTPTTSVNTDYLKTENESEQIASNTTNQSQKMVPEISAFAPDSNKTCEEAGNVHTYDAKIRDLHDEHVTKLSCDFQSNTICPSYALREGSESNQDPIEISEMDYNNLQNNSEVSKQSDKTPIIVETPTSCGIIDIKCSSKSNEEEMPEKRKYKTPASQDISVKEVTIQQDDNSYTSDNILKNYVSENNCLTHGANMEIKNFDEMQSMTLGKESVIEIKYEIRSTENIVKNQKPYSSNDTESKTNVTNEDDSSNDDVIIVSAQSNVLPGVINSSATQSSLRFEYKIEVEHQSEDLNSELVAYKSAAKELNHVNSAKNNLVIFDNTDVENEIEITSDSDAKVDKTEKTICDNQSSITTCNKKNQAGTAKALYVESHDSCAEIKGGESQCFCYKKQNVQMLDHGYALKDSCFEKECKINTMTDVSISCEPSSIHRRPVGDKCNNEVVLKGIEYEDPVIGTCYVFPLAESPTESSCEPESDIFNDSTEEIIQVIQEISEDGTVDKVILETKEIAIEEPFFKLNIPKRTYSKYNMYHRKNSKLRKISLKRKIDMTDIKISRKRYRKGKNIDYPKITTSVILDSAYSKEYKQVFDYCSSLKFSYSQPFHKEFIDVEDIIKDWPLQGEYSSDFHDQIDCNDLLFSDLDIQQYDIPFDPMEQSLAEELTVEYRESDFPRSSVTETNFNMGFGEGSDRVIQNLEDVGDDSKFSAATLSDVKQPQPFLLSEFYENDQEKTNENSRNDQIKQLKRFITYIQMRDKVRSFFKKTTVELKYDWMKKQEKYKNAAMSDERDFTSFPFDLYNATDFMELPPTDVFVQVVQVGQLPVSAAAQNPVTCDPRVTQVSNASPSQCSVDNSPQDDSQPTIKTEYTELTTADLSSLPLMQEYTQHHQTLPMESQEHSNISLTDENIPIETEIKSIVKIELMEETEVKEEQRETYDNNDSPNMENRYVNNVDYSFDTNTTNATGPVVESEQDFQALYNSSEKQNIPEIYSTQHQQQPKQQNGTPEKTDQIAHAMNAAGITTIAETMTNTTRAQALVNILSQKLRQGSIGATQSTTNNYTKATSINAMSLQQALAQILPPPLNQTNTSENNQHNQNSSVTPQVLHIVQGKNASGSQITLVDNSQQSVINDPNATPVLHIVQNKSGTTGATSNGAATQQTNSFGGLSLVDAGLQQGGNQLLHIVNTGNQKNNNATGQLLKRVNLLTNLANVQGSNEQKMVQFVCKSADGKAIQLNAPHQRSMVLRLQPIETPNVATTPKPAENQDLSPTSNSTNSLGGKDNAASQQEIKSRSVYEENYAKFIQNSSSKTLIPEKSTSLPKFNQAFGKPVFQDGGQKQNDINSNSSHLSVNTNSEGGECQSSDNAINLDHIGQISSPPLLLRKSPAQTSQSQANLVQQIKQTITPMNIQTMHGGVIYTRQIPVNIGGGQTINLITVPSTELVDESGQKQQPGSQNELEQSIIKIVPQNQTASNSEISSEDGNAQMNVQNETNQNPQPQPVLTQMRIKLPMLSKTPQMVSGARVVRPSFFQIQRNVIGGANQPVYQQLVLTAAPPLGQQTIRLPQTPTSRQIKVTTENQSSAESQMSSSTLEQLREFDMVLEQVKERSSVPPNSNSSTTFTKLHTSSTDTTDSSASSTSTETSQQVLYSIGNNHQPLNVAYVNRKATVATPTTSTFVRSPDSSGIVDSPTSSTHVQIPHTVTTDSSHSEQSPPKPKVSSKSKSRPKASSNPPNTLKINPIPPKTSAQKPLEDEQTTQRILYILAEYKEQVENSPDKDKPAPRRRSNPPSNPSGSSKRKKSSSGSRRHGGRDISPIHGEDTCRTMGSEDSSCGTSQGDCNESCLDSHSPQDSPRKVVRKLTFEHETPPPQQPRQQPQRNVIVADGQTITVARGTAGKPATAVLMPANYILPVSMVKGGQQIAIVTNRGPKLLTVGGGEGGATNALLLQRLIGPAGLKPVLARPGVRHVRLPTAALHNLQAFNIATATTVQPPDSTASPAPAPTPPELVDTRATSSPWTDRDCQEDVKPERGSSPEGSEPWNLPSSGDPHDYTYEETVRADNLDRTVLDPIPDRYSPDMEAQRIFDKMFDVDSKKSYLGDSPRCVYDIDASDCDDKPYHQVVQKKDGNRQHRLTHVSAAALRHKYAILEHELRLQKSLSEECEDLGVDSPSAAELFPEAELLFAASPAHEHAHDAPHHSHTPQPTLLNQSGIPQPDIDDQIATDQLLSRAELRDEQHELQLGLDDVGMVGVGVGAGLPAALDAEEFARAHPNTTFHSEPTDDEPVQPFTIAGLKARHITSTIFHSNRAPATVLMTAPQTTVISQATADGASHNAVKYDIDNMINSLPSNGNINLSSVLVKDEGLTRFDSILNDSRELHLSNTASAIVHSAGNATQVIRRVCYDDDKRDNRFLMDEPDALIAGDDAKMIAEDSSRDATLESMAGDGDDDRSSPERHADLFWESNSASGRSESRRPLDFSSDSDKCCKSPSYDETNSTDSSGLGAHMRLDSVIKDARGIERSGSADGSSADDTHPPLRTYPPKRMYHPLEREVERSLSGKTRAGERSPDSLEVRRRASGRGVVKRGCHCCNGSPAPSRPKKSRQRKPTIDFTN